MNRTMRTFAISCLTALLTISSGLPEQVLAGSTLRQGLPGRRVGGGTRGEVALAGKPLTALIPANYLGLTIAAYPTFFFYVPPTSKSHLVEFVLRDQDDRQVYESTFMTTGGGVIGFNLPEFAAIKPLELGQNYRWYFSVIPDPNNRAADVSVEGWVQRIELNPILANKLAKATPLERATLYAQAGIWQDALMTVAELSRSQPTDAAVTAKWAQLLQSIGLPKIAQEPLVKPSAAPITAPIR